MGTLALSVRDNSSREQNPRWVDINKEPKFRFGRYLLFSMISEDKFELD